MRADRRDVRREERFETLYARHYPSIYAFVHRRSAEIGGEVSDVVADVFAVAWRRLVDEALSAGRGGGEDPRAEVVRAAIERLRPAERDAVRLVMWEGLTHEEAGRVLECSANAVALRLHKARKRLEAELERAAGSSGLVPLSEAR